MLRQIIMQPDGKFAVWSTIVDNFIYINCSEKELVDFFVKELVDFFVKEYKRNLIKEIRYKVKQLKNRDNPYYQFTISFEDAIKTIKEVHGEKSREYKEIKKEIKGVN